MTGKALALSDGNEPDVLDEQGFDLTPMQRAFVYNYASNGGNGRKAAEKAGYAASGAKAYASRMLRIPSINRAIYTVAASQLGALVPQALRKVSQLSMSATSQYVQLEAAKDLLDRAGFTAPKKVDVSGSVSVVIDLG